MSVICFGPDEWAKVKGMMRSWMTGPDKIDGIFRYTKKYMNSRGLTTEDKLEKDIVDWLFHQLELCNAFAYAAQYQDAELQLPSSPSIYECKPIRCSRYELLSALEHIDYNLSDNCGNCYLPMEYREMFDTLVDHVKRICIDAYKVHLAAHEMRSSYEISK